jgi:hypothetical protein
LVKNAKRGPAEKIKGVLYALLLLSPAIETFSYWRGDEKSEIDVVDPVLILVVSRAIEMVIESFPEAAIQLAILFKTEEVETLMIFSLPLVSPPPATL